MMTIMITTKSGDSKKTTDLLQSFGVAVSLLRYFFTNSEVCMNDNVVKFKKKYTKDMTTDIIQLLNKQGMANLGYNDEV